MPSRDDDWAEAKRLCRLSAEDVRMAKALGLNPRKLIKNIPSPKERWKAPVRDWVRELYRKRHGAAVDPAPTVAARPRVKAGTHEQGASEDDAWLPVEAAWQEEIQEEDRLLLRRQESFRAGADYVAFAFARLPCVERVVLIGSVAQPLRREVPRFRKFRRAGVALWHDCKDVDLAVWVADTGQLESLRKALGRAVNALFAEIETGVAHHQVDVFLLEPATDRYLGRLCHFGTCPKGKPECHVPGCGASPFLRQHDDFVFDPRSLDPVRSIVLFDRTRACGPPSLDRWQDRWRDDIPF
jgi:hypothetical protein